MVVAFLSSREFQRRLYHRPQATRHAPRPAPRGHATGSCADGARVGASAEGPDKTRKAAARTRRPSQAPQASPPPSALSPHQSEAGARPSARAATRCPPLGWRPLNSHQRPHRRRSLPLHRRPPHCRILRWPWLQHRGRRSHSPLRRRSASPRKLNAPSKARRPR